MGEAPRIGPVAGQAVTATVQASPGFIMPPGGPILGSSGGNFPPPVPSLICSTSLGSFISGHAYGRYPPAVAGCSITPIPLQPVLLLALAAAMNHNTPPDLNITTPTNYALLDYGLAGRPTSMLAYRSIMIPSGSYLASSTYTPGFDPTVDSWWAAGQIAIKTSAFMPVQHGVAQSPYGSIPNVPTPGNILIACQVGTALDSSSFVYANSAGWTSLLQLNWPAAGTGTATVIAAFFARCIDGSETGDPTPPGNGGKAWLFNGTSGYVTDVCTWLSEWVIS